MLLNAFAFQITYIWNYGLFIVILIFWTL